MSRVETTQKALRHGQTVLAGGLWYRVKMGIGLDTDWHIYSVKTGAQSERSAPLAARSRAEGGVSHVFRFTLSDRPGVEFTLIDADSHDADEARAVLDWQFGSRVVAVREASESEAPNDSMGNKQ